MLKVMKDWLTGIDGKTYDPARASMLFAVVSFIVLAGWSTIHLHQKWDALAFGSGFAAILAGGGFGIAAKSKTEPTADKPEA